MTTPDHVQFMAQDIDGDSLEFNITGTDGTEVFSGQRYRPSGGILGTGTLFWRKFADALDTADPWTPCTWERQYPDGGSHGLSEGEKWGWSPLRTGEKVNIMRERHQFWVRYRYGVIWDRCLKLPHTFIQGGSKRSAIQGIYRLCQHFKTQTKQSFSTQ